MRILAGLLCCLVCSASTLVRLTSGGPGGVDPQGNVWAADASFSGGAAWTVANQPGLASQPIPYQSLRYSNPPGASFSYSFAVPSAQYTVLLRFLEPNKTAAGQRIFTVAINGIVVLPGLDLFNVAGALQPYDKTFTVDGSGGTIRIDFSAAMGNAVISAIEIDNKSSAAWVPPLATFATPPVSPAVGDTYLFTDVGVASCTGGGSQSQQCRWNGTAWAAIQPVNSLLFNSAPGYVVANIQCVPGVVDFTALNTTAAANLEVTILASVPGDFRFDHIMVGQSVPFVGIPDLTVSMGRPGSNNYELTGALVPLAAGYVGPWYARPIPPQYSGTYSAVLNFASGPSVLPLNALTAGSLSWEVCGYSMVPFTAALRLGSVKVCSGSAAPGESCSGLYQINVIRADGSALPLVGWGMSLGRTPPGITWTDVQ